MLAESAAAVVWVFGLLAVLTVAYMVAQVHQWRAGRLLIDRRHLILRLSNGTILLVLWAVLGVMLIGFDPRANLRLFANLLLAVVVLLVVLIVLALIDLRLVALQQLRTESRLASDTARSLRSELHDR